MSHLLISSRGELDPHALSLMGASVKDTGAIGEFGSGLKYAIATLLRHGVKFQIYSGPRLIPIETKPESFRGQTFSVIWVDGQPTSITTRTGPKWHVRDAIREIWSNAVDEGFAERGRTPEAGRSTFVIKVTPEIQTMLDNWEQYFCHDVPALYTSLEGRILRQPTPNFFRRGVWICEDTNLLPIFSYDFVNVNLPESRRVDSFSVASDLNGVLRNMAEIEIWETILTHPTFETSAERYMLAYYSVSSAARSIAQAAFAKHWTHYGWQSQQIRIAHKLNASHRVKWVGDNEAYTLHRLGIPDIASDRKVSVNYDLAPWPIGVKEKVAEQVQYLCRFGVDLTKFEIVYAKFFDSTIIAMADNGQCLIGPRAMETSVNGLRKALVEEWTHLEHGVADHTVSQQHVYLDLIINIMGEIA